MHFDADKVRANARSAATEDLLDRVTVYRGEMEPEAVVLIEEELRERGVSAAEQADHEDRRRGSALVGADGVALRCSQCRQPAVWQGTVWHRLWGVVPLFPRQGARCEARRPAFTWRRGVCPRQPV